MENSTGKIRNEKTTCEEFEFNLAIFSTVLFAISMCGNSVTVLIFSRRKFTPAILLFLILATLDMLFLLCQFLFTNMPILCQNTGGCRGYAEANAYLEAYAFPIVVIMYCTSTWVVVIMACNRYLAITKPLQYHRFITVKYIYIELLVLLILCVAYNIPRFFEFDTNTTQNSTSTSNAFFSTETELYTNKYYQVYYKILSFLILMIFIPLTLLIYFTHKLLQEIKRSNARRKTMLQGSRFAHLNNFASEEQSITITLVVIVITFILFHVPIGINRILQLIFVYRYGSVECVAVNNTTYLYLVSRIFNEFAEINAAFNCVIYGATSPQFRRDLSSLCQFRKTNNSTERTQRTNRNFTTRTLDRNSNKPEEHMNNFNGNFVYIREISV